MGEVIALIRIMPDGIIADEHLDMIIDDIKTEVKDPVKLGRIEIKKIAFGIRGLDVTVSVPDSEGGLDPIVAILKKINRVDSVEVVDIGRI